LIEFYDAVERGVVGLLGLIALLVGLAQVLGRYVYPSAGSGWGEEVMVYLLIWATMIVSSDLVRTDGHVRPDLVLRLMGPQTQRVVECVNCVVGMVFAAGLAWYGWQIVDTAMLLDERSFTGLAFPLWIYDLSLPVGSALLVLRYAMRLWRFALRYDPATMRVGDVLAHESTPGLEP
jgi:C4-dicarboxylate transporter, DctQ subunit